MSTVAILPVKTFIEAKQRLRRGLDAGERRVLVEAMFTDVLIALRRTGGVDRTLVITADHGAQRIAWGYGATVLEDEEHGHNIAARHGIRHAREEGATRALLIPGDCPLLDPGQLDELLNREAGERSALIVPDRHRTGTNALLLTPPDVLVPSFGPGSCERHAAQAEADGVAHEIVPVPTLALDVDTPEDLDALQDTLAVTHGGAAHTRGLLGQLMRSRGE